jgi:fido (protein-threonine AMPylation protein)
MNETIISPRQKVILNLLAQFSSLTREEIAEKLLPTFEASKATLARDLAELVANQQIKLTGSGPSTAYQPASIHPLLTYMDLPSYFLLGPDQRKSVKSEFSFDIFDKTTHVFSKIEIDELKLIYRSFDEATRNLELTLFIKELERFVIELSWKSSQIEGNTYSLLETETLIKQSREAQGHSKEEAMMILNHKEAFKLMLEHRADFKHLSMSTVLELHNVLTKDLHIGSGIRKHIVGITGTSYRPLDNEWQVKEVMDKAINTVNLATYPLEKALLASSLIAYIQPFEDGNKRTSRMLSNAILMAHDYFPLSYRSVNETEYKEAMILFYETNNLYHLKRLFIDQYKFALHTYFV